MTECVEILLWSTKQQYLLGIDQVMTAVVQNHYLLLFLFFQLYFGFRIWMLWHNRDSGVPSTSCTPAPGTVCIVVLCYGQIIRFRRALNAHRTLDDLDFIGNISGFLVLILILDLVEPVVSLRMFYWRGYANCVMMDLRGTSPLTSHFGPATN